MSEVKMQKRRAEEAKAAEEAKRLDRCVTFISEDDGCEVTVTPEGHVLYNVADWY